MKNSLRIITLIISILLFTNSLRADVERVAYLPTGFSIVPPSPEVGELIDYSEFGVDYHSGLPQISFNLFTIKSGDLEFPITLSYKAGGIKYEYNAINYGLGWFVTSTATIGRTVVGLPDEFFRERNDAQNNNITGLFRETTGRPVLFDEFYPTDTISYISAWHISKIKNLSGDSIIFKYEDGVERVRGGIHSSESYPLNRDYAKYIQHWHTTSGSTMYSPKIISQISGGGTTVKFIYSTKMSADKSNSVTECLRYILRYFKMRYLWI
ncbi:MAG: hypothetical protein K2M00_07620 [Muribaculaceae bacterium]|nr:hypothetical protein [Muribaculaceae bacterium]